MENDRIYDRNSSVYTADHKARILIVDDHPMVREGLSLRISLQPDMEMCGEAGAEDEGLALVLETRPDLVLIDVSLKEGNGIELIKRIKSRSSQTKMLVVSGFDEWLYGERALRAGASGYLSKQESNEHVMDAIRLVLAGQRYVSPSLARRLVDQALVGREETKTGIELLTDRELQVFRMIGNGQVTSDIANRLFLSTRTVDSHRENIKRKLGLNNAGELSRAAVQWVLENG